MKTPVLSRRRRAANAWYADGLAFECRRCGSCCRGAPGYVWLAEGEIPRLARRLGITEEEFRAAYTRPARGRLTLRERADGDCILLDPASLACRAYEDRPVQCRTWPWWRENLVAPEAWERCGRECPGVGTGRIHSSSFILQQCESDEEANGMEGEQPA